MIHYLAVWGNESRTFELWRWTKKDSAYAYRGNMNFHELLYVHNFDFDNVRNTGQEKFDYVLKI